MPLKGPLSLADRFCATHDWVGGETLTECPDCAAEQRDRYREALEIIRRMIDGLANSKYAKAAGGDTLGAEIHRIATKALSR